LYNLQYVNILCEDINWICQSFWLCNSWNLAS